VDLVDFKGMERGFSRIWRILRAWNADFRGFVRGKSAKNLQNTDLKGMERGFCGFVRGKIYRRLVIYVDKIRVNLRKSVKSVL